MGKNPVLREGVFPSLSSYHNEILGENQVRRCHFLKGIFEMEVKKGLLFVLFYCYHLLSLSKLSMSLISVKYSEKDNK